MKKIIKQIFTDRPTEFKYKISEYFNRDRLYVSYTKNIFGRRKFENVQYVVDVYPPHFQNMEIGYSVDINKMENFMLTYNTLEKYLEYKTQTMVDYDRLTKAYEEKVRDYKNTYNLL